MSEWQPIETAPKDGTYVLLAREMPLIKDWCMGVAFWTGDFDCWSIAGMTYFHEPTHWMPLPAAPATEEGR